MDNTGTILSHPAAKRLDKEKPLSVGRNAILWSAWISEFFSGGLIQIGIGRSFLRKTVATSQEMVELTECF